MLSASAQDRTLHLLSAAICAMTLQQCCVALQSFITTPTSTTICAGANATFFCASQIGRVSFVVNGSDFFDWTINVEEIITQVSGQSRGVLRAPGTMENDYLMIACKVVTSEGSESSNVSVLRIQGPPSSVSNVTYDAASGTLSWIPPSDALNTSLLSYQVTVRSQTTGQTLTSNITMETRITLPLPKSCGSSYFIQVHSMCEVLMGASAQLSYEQNMSISNLVASPGNANSITLSWTPPLGPPLNYSVEITRDDGYKEAVFVTNTSAKTVPLSQQLCTLYHITVATMCGTATSNTSSGPKSYVHIVLGTPPTVHDLQCNTTGTSLHVTWEVPLDSSYLTYYVEVTEQNGRTVYSNFTMEKALVIAVATAVSKQYHLTVTSMCGTVNGTSAYQDISPTQLTILTPVKGERASQKTSIAIGTGIGGVIVALLVAVAIAVIVYKRCKGGSHFGSV